MEKKYAKVYAKKKPLQKKWLYVEKVLENLKLLQPEFLLP